MISSRTDLRPAFSALSRRSPEAEATALLSPQMCDFAAMAAASLYPVTLTGETGSGKTHLARLIHDLSPRSGGPFVPVNCGAIPHELFEREMFGNVRGAFTGATDSRPGLFEAAEGGTLFLDELGELPLDVQPKLLRVLEERSVRRVGSTQFVPVDVRIITATNRDLRDMVERREFREDLYYRCCVLEFDVRPLRERRREIPALVRHLLRKNAPPRTEPPAIGDEALREVCAYDWPGNIRELGNALCQAAIYARGGAIEPRHLPERVRAPREGAAAPGPASAGASPRRPRYTPPEGGKTEREVIAEALCEARHNRTHAARRLGMSRSTLWAKIKQYGMDRTACPEPPAAGAVS